MNNKLKGTNFEREVCDILSKKGYWVHFLSPDARGAQPFDVIAVKDGEAFVADCKTCDYAIFPLTRLEDNQINAFGKWVRCGNPEPVILVKHFFDIYAIPYSKLMKEKRIRLEALDASYRWE